MRRRLLFSTLAVAVTAVLLFGVPLAFVLRQLQVTVAQDQVQRDATTLAKTLENRVRSGMPASITDAEDAARSLPDRYVSITQDGGQSYHTGTLPPRGSAIIGRAVTRDFRVTVEADRAVSNERGKLALVISLAGLAVAVAVALAIIQARRLTRPLQELAEAAGRLGSGEAGPLGRRYGIPELDQVAEGLDGSAERISELLAAEREFAADASHQLRTPLTALSMRLEEILAAADQPEVVHEEGTAALLQAERLTDVVGQLLGRTHRSAAGPRPAQVSVDDVVAQQVVEWDPAFRRRNRKLEVSGEKNLAARTAPGDRVPGQVHHGRDDEPRLEGDVAHGREVRGHDADVLELVGEQPDRHDHADDHRHRPGPVGVVLVEQQGLLLRQAPSAVQELVAEH